jgi:hypothetical protein
MSVASISTLFSRLGAAAPLLGALFGSASIHAGPVAPPAAVPSLDQMAGDWIPMKNVALPPAVHNFHDMVLFYREDGKKDFDLTSFTSGSTGAILWYDDPHKIYPTIHLLIDGKEYPAIDCRWYAYRALRRNADCGGLSVETDLRMINEQAGILCRVTVSNPSATEHTTKLSLELNGAMQPTGRAAMTPFLDPKAPTAPPRFITATCPAQMPDASESTNGKVRWTWNVTLPPGGQRVLEFVSGHDAGTKRDQVATRVTGWADDFTAQFDACEQVWEQRWADAFTPGNHHFSGHVPTLISDNAALKRNYYMGVLTMLILERTQFPISPRTFITSGEREPGKQFYWDASMGAPLWALLEPEGMKASLRSWLIQNPRSGDSTNANRTQGYDTKHYPEMHGYAFNACTIFKTAYDYLRYTGDDGFLQETLGNGKTVLENMDALATDWQTLPPGPPGSGLVNYGNNENLLECAPAYINCVPSVNAQDVWMMRCAADLQDMAGNSARATELRKLAADFLPHVLALYEPGAGVWDAYHMDGQKVQLRHCVDYIYVGNALAHDLTAAQKQEMNGFVKSELLMPDWMRAMSPKDAAAARSDRPDHGPMGAYDGWPPLVVGAMWRLGDSQDAFDFYCRTAAVTKEGPFAQAREFYGPNRTERDAPVRIAYRQGCMKECISGAAFASTVIDTFFGFSPSIDGKTMLADPLVPRPFTGELEHVTYRQAQWNLTASSHGVTAKAE